MVVMKFGGTSVGSAERMNEVISIIGQTSEQKLIVLSAMSGTTNALVEIATHLIEKNSRSAASSIEALYKRYLEVIKDLFEDQVYQDRGLSIIDQEFSKLWAYVELSNKRDVTNDILAEGELLSTSLFEILCLSQNIDAILIPALDFMRIDANGDPQTDSITNLIVPYIKKANGSQIIITQGYICRDNNDNITNLQRGGSDYTATLLGAALQSDEIQIWTDIDGIHNNDPRIVNDTQPIRNLSYREAAELAYFGAKILHPTCVLPAERMSVPLRLKYTIKPDAPGTLISDQTSNKSITAIAAKDNITAIKIYSHRMLNAYGFLRKVFQVFEDHKTSVDMITTSEVAVSLTIDDVSQLSSIEAELVTYGEVEVSHDHSIICIVGNELYDNSEHLPSIFSCLNDIPCRMVSMGGSRHNVSILINSNDKSTALKSLNKIF